MTNDLDRVRCHSKYSHKSVDKDDLIKMTIIIVTIMNKEEGEYSCEEHSSEYSSVKYFKMCVYIHKKNTERNENENNTKKEIEIEDTNVEVKDREICNT